MNKLFNVDAVTDFGARIFVNTVIANDEMMAIRMAELGAGDDVRNRPIKAGKRTVGWKQTYKCLPIRGFEATWCGDLHSNGVQ